MDWSLHFGFVSDILISTHPSGELSTGVGVELCCSAESAPCLGLGSELARCTQQQQ